MYHTIIGFKDTVSRVASERNKNCVLEDIMKKAFNFAIEILAVDYDLEENNINAMVVNKKLALLDVPKSHPSFSVKGDFARGWVGAMIDDELKLLTSYAVEYSD